MSFTFNHLAPEISSFLLEVAILCWFCDFQRDIACKSRSQTRQDLPSSFSDGIIGGLANSVGFALPIVSCDEDYAEPPKKIALRLDLRAD
jgi:hypothetical protein